MAEKSSSPLKKNIQKSKPQHLEHYKKMEIEGVFYNCRLMQYDHFSTSRKDLLQTLYKKIDCRVVEVVNLSRDVSIWVDEEGLFKQSHWMEELDYIPVIKINGHHIVGHVVFLGGCNDQGETLSLNMFEFDKFRVEFEYGRTYREIEPQVDIRSWPY